MSVNLQQYRGALGAFNSRFNHNNSVFHTKPNVSSIASAYFAIFENFCTFLSVLKSFWLMLSTYLLHVWLFLIRTKWSGNTEQSPGHKPNSCQSFSVFYWNLNSILPYNFIKLFLLRAYIALANLMLFAYKRPILTLASQMIMTVWKFPVIIYLE